MLFAMPAVPWHSDICENTSKPNEIHRYHKLISAVNIRAHLYWCESERESENFL